jgi:arsenite transporter
MKRQQLEQHQVWIYISAILAGLALGSIAPGLSGPLEAVLWPVLGLLLYTTFTQVTLTQLPKAFRDRRFMSAVLIGNFVFIPLVVWGLLVFLPDDPAIRLGVLLVLLVPCTDWYITFTHLAGGDTRRAIAATPVNLLVQLCLLPVYLWLFMGNAFLDLLAADRIALVFVSLIVLPLLAAWLTERWAERHTHGHKLVAGIGWLPVPLLAIVVFLIAASQVQAVVGALPVLGHVLGAFVAFLVAAALIGLLLARLFSLPAASGSALVFSLGTRNSFVVLPLALALAPQWQTATVVIVFQSLVELFGMVAYLWIIPKLIVLSPSEFGEPLRSKR